jgi:membrane protease YdiL (CAAX protease family)
MGMQPTGYWPVAAPLPQPQPVAWPIGSVPWGYTNPPAVPPILEAPCEFHPPAPHRAFFSVKRRVSPRLYAFGVVIGLPALAALLAYMISAAAGYQIPKGDVPVWVIVEVIGLVAIVGTFAYAAAQGRQRRADGWKDYAGPSPLITMGALVALVLVLQIPLELALKSANVDLQSAPATLAITLVYLAGYVSLVYLLAVRPKALSWRDIAFPKRLAPSTDDWGGSEPLLQGRPVQRLAAARSRFSGRLGDFLIPVVMAVPLMIASNIAGLGLLFVLGLKTTDINPEAATPLDAVSRLMLLIAVAVVAPVGEEIFFRGFSANSWGRSMSRNSAILRASLFFAFVHVMNTPSSDIGLFWRVALFNFGARVPVAFALTWLYMRRRSIVASGTLHASYNGLITLITFIAVP